MIGILGKKLGMTQLFQEDGTCVPVTVVQAGPCHVMQVKVKDAAELDEEHRTAATNRGKKSGKSTRPRRSDGYYAVQLGFDERRAKSTPKAEAGHAQKSGGTPKAFVREIRYAELPAAKQGEQITVSAFKDVKHVDVTGTSKGRGFAGTIKRWNFSRQSTTHGNSKHHRKPGGIGRQYGTAKGVPKGKKMCGHYGMEKVTTQNLEVVKIDEERNLIYLRGAVPGHRSGFVVVRETVKK